MLAINFVFCVVEMEKVGGRQIVLKNIIVMQAAANSRSSLEVYCPETRP